MRTDSTTSEGNVTTEAQREEKGKAGVSGKSRDASDTSFGTSRRGRENVTFGLRDSRVFGGGLARVTEVRRR